MVTRYETLKVAFRERVLPHFPKAERRFKKHFRASYEILRMTEADSKLNLAFTLLGLKPLSLVENWYPSETMTKMLIEAGLRINVHPKPNRDPGTEVYDPELAVEPLTKMLGRIVSPDNVAQAVREALYTYDHSHELLGYPQPFPWLSLPDLIYTTRSLLEIKNLGQEYHSGFGCVISDIKSGVQMLPVLAAAAAIIEDIRDSPTNIISQARIRRLRIFFGRWKKEVEKISTSIQRTGVPAEWIIGLRTK